MPNKKWRTARLICCRKCGQPGGTLHKVDDNVYEHAVCPHKLTKAVRTVPGLVVPKKELIAALHKQSSSSKPDA